MKLKSLIASLLISLISGTAFANEIIVENVSPKAKTLHMVYAVAHKNQGQSTVLGPKQEINLVSSTTIQLDLEGYQWVGVIPISINGHALPPQINQFAKPQQCALATDIAHTQGRLKISFDPDRSNPALNQLKCTVDGGAF